jgi:uncharacterized repeat protein (TIGR01451 family)
MWNVATAAFAALVPIVLFMPDPASQEPGLPPTAPAHAGTQPGAESWAGARASTPTQEAAQAQPGVQASAQAGVQASAQASIGTGLGTSVDAAAAAVLRPNIQVTMQVSPAEAKVGDRVDFIVRVSNDGPAASSGVNVLDRFPAAFRDVSWSCAAIGQTNCVQASGAGSIEMSGVAMAAGSALTFTASTVLGELPAAGMVSNQVVAQDSTGGEDADPGDNFAQATVKVAGLVTAMAAAPATVSAGGTVTYTYTLSNPGAAPYAGASFSSDLGDVLADATLNEDFKASDGSKVELNGTHLSWSGTVPAKGTVNVTYSVSVSDNPGGDGKLDASMISAGCADRCQASVGMLSALLKRSVSSSTAKPGETVTFTVDVANTGAVDYPQAQLSEDLTGVLDSAIFNGDAKASHGTVSYTAPKLNWTGDIPAGQTARITYSVLVTETGDAMLTSALTPAQRMGCESCSIEVRIARLTQEISVEERDGLIGYQVKLMNKGLAPFTGASFVNDLTHVLDDAALDGEPSASSGRVTIDPPTLTWTGDVGAGESVTLTYAVSGRPGGDGVLRNVVKSADTNCRAADAKCLSTFEAGGQTETFTAAETPVTGTPVWRTIAIGLAILLAGMILIMITLLRRNEA